MVGALEEREAVVGALLVCDGATLLTSVGFAVEALLTTVGALELIAGFDLSEETLLTLLGREP